VTKLPSRRKRKINSARRHRESNGIFLEERDARNVNSFHCMAINYPWRLNALVQVSLLTLGLMLISRIIFFLSWRLFLIDKERERKNYKSVDRESLEICKVLNFWEISEKADRK